MASRSPESRYSAVSLKAVGSTCSTLSQAGLFLTHPLLTRGAFRQEFIERRLRNDDLSIDRREKFGFSK